MKSADSSLYRKEAITAREVKTIGSIVLARPVSFAMLTLAALFSAVALILFAIFGTYTKRNTVAGELIPSAGLVQVFAYQPGVVTETLVSEGVTVKKGDVLFVLSSDRQSQADAPIQASISEQVKIRRLSLENELTKTKALNESERLALSDEIASHREELSALELQLENQRKRVQLGVDGLARLNSLRAQGFVSQQQLDQKNDDLLEYERTMRALERDRIAVRRALQAKQSELGGQGFKQRNQLAQVERGLASTTQEFAESEAKRRVVITAPQTGTVTAVFAELGQSVDTSRALVRIVPAGSKLHARLYAPSKMIGFVRSGDTVLMRYDAFPYQKFGHAKARIETVSRVAVAADELKSRGISTHGADSLYLITAQLSEQTIHGYGQRQPLQAGMSIQADILQDTRPIYEWVLEPLLSISGKL